MRKFVLENKWRKQLYGDIKRCDTDKFSQESVPQLSTITTDNNQIDTKSRNNPVTKHTYIGCWVENKMPIKPENGYMIVNNESDPSEMEHWILIYKNNDKHYFLTRSDSTSIYGGNIASYCNET